MGTGIKAVGTDTGIPARHIIISDNYLDDCVSAITLDRGILYATVSGNVVRRGRGLIGGAVSCDRLDAPGGGSRYLAISGNCLEADSNVLAVTNAAWCTVAGNTIIGLAGANSGLCLVGLAGSSITGNTVVGSGDGMGLQLANSQDLAVQGNRVDGWAVGVSFDINSRNNQVSGNSFSNVALPVRLAGTSQSLRHNRGIVTEAAGVAVVGPGDHTTVVPHGLHVPPDLRHISITPTSTLGAAARFWVSDVDAAQFTINLDAPPGDPGATFAWQVNWQPGSA